MDKNVCINTDILDKIFIYLFNIVNSKPLKKDISVKARLAARARRTVASDQISLLQKLCTHDTPDKMIFNNMWNKMTKKLNFPKGVAITTKYKPRGFDNIIEAAKRQLDAQKRDSMMEQFEGLTVNRVGKGGTKKRQNNKYKKTRKNKF